ncbi:MAG: nickel pincer cofactor biosynthesis protein LarC [Myxococcaceae bacterium]
MGRVLYLEPVGGIAGDMFMAAGIDLGVEVSAIEKALSGLGVSGWKLSVSKQARHAITGTHVDVVVDKSAAVPERSLSDITALIRACSTMSEEAKNGALRTFEIIGRAEAKIHNVPLEQIHFHEVGAVDSIVDICASAIVLELLGSPEVFCAPPPMGSGIAKMAHGSIPIPAPATLEILREVPVRFEGVGELTTPTGAAILKSFARVGETPALIPERTGYGIGTKDWKDRANVLRATIGTTLPAGTLRRLSGESSLETIGQDFEATRERIREIEAKALEKLHDRGNHALVFEANLDDCSPQLIGLLIERLISAGALDAWVTPVTMKKGRPGHVLSALCRADKQDEIVSLLFAESTTLGVRSYEVKREELERRFESVETKYGAIRIKLGSRRGAVLNANPEYEDCRAAGEKHGVAVKQVWAEALAAWTRREQK